MSTNNQSTENELAEELKQFKLNKLNASFQKIVAQFDTTGMTKIIWRDNGLSSIWPAETEYYDITSNVPVQNLLYGNGKIIEGNLISLLQDESFDIDDSHVKSIIRNANDDFLDSIIERGKNKGEMYLQQNVYNIVAKVFDCFSSKDPYSDFYEYVANENIKVDEAIQVVGASGLERQKFEKKPDAGIRIYKEFYSIGIMEIKPKGDDTNLDMTLSVCLLCSSALAIRHKMKVKKEINIPFVIGNACDINLYVVTLGENEEKPKVRRVYYHTTYKFNANDMRNVVVRLFYLLKQIKMLLETQPKFFFYCRKISNNGLRNLTNAATHKDKKKDDTTDKGKGSGASESGNASVLAARKERLAMEAIAQGGKITNIEYPFDRFINAANYTLEEFLNYYQQSSPFLFVGKCDSKDVFCKAELTIEQEASFTIENEMKMLEKANSKKVPSPALIKDLCNLHANDSTSQVYQVMVMQRMTRDRINEDDLLAYTKSLIDTCQKLHSAGILHCDIKPDNLAWDRTNQVVSLIDFGHAQNIEGASSYRATEGFEAPEVLDSQSHSCESDIYSIGKTLLFILDGLADKISGCDPVDPSSTVDNLDKVRKIAKSFCMKDPKSRLDLSVASEEIEHEISNHGRDESNDNSPTIVYTQVSY